MSDQVRGSEEFSWADVDAERALDRFRTLVNIVDDGIYQLDAEGRFVAVDDTIVESTGYSREKLLGEHASLVLADEDVTRIQQEIHRRFTDGDSKVEPLECTTQTADGDTIPCELELHLLVDDNTFQGTVGVVRDITDRKQTVQELHARERELREKERRYEAIFDDPNILVGLLNPDGTVQDINQTAMEYIDATLEDVTGEPFWETPWWGEGDGVKSDVKVWTERAADGEYVDFEADLTNPDDEPYTLSGYFRPVTNDDGEVVSIIVSERDVTERKERERDLELFRTLLDHSTDSVLVVDPETGRYLDVNDTACERHGYSREEFLDLTVFDLETEIPDQETWRSFVEELRAERQLTFDGYHRRKDGTTYPVEVNASYVELDQEYVLGISRDVTERREYEQKLEERERRLSTLMGNVPGMVYRCHNERGWPMEFVSDACMELTGYDPEALESGDISWGADVMVQEDRENLWETVQEAVDSGETFSETYRIETADSEVRWIRDYGRGVFDDEGELVNIEGIIADITERKRLETELEESERRYRTLVENFPNGGVGVYDEDLRYTLVEGTMWDDIDVDPESLEGNTIHEALPPETADDVEPIFRAALKGETNSVVSTLGGRTYRVWATPLRDANGAITGGQSFAVDLTEQLERERQITESERRYRTLAEYFPNGIVTLFDDDFEYDLAAGKGFEDIPVDPDEVEGRHFSDVWDESTVDALRPAFEAALDGEERSVELSYAGREWILHAVPITDEGGDVFAGMTMAQDITERKERERYLEDTKSQLEAATEAGTVGTWEWNVRDDEMVAGTTFAETFGVDPEAAREGVSLDRFLSSIHEADRNRIEAEIEAALASCGDYEAEYRVRDADDELRWVVARGRVECDESGEPVRFPGALTDITERKRAELELQRNNEQLESLFEVLPVGVVVAEADGEIVEANGVAQEIWGGDVFDADSVEEYERYPVRWTDSGERVDPEEMTLARVIDGEEVTDPDVFEIETFDGERRIVQAKGMPVCDEFGEVTRGVVTLTDITERREAQRRLEESERRYRTLVENFPNGSVGLFNEDLEYTAVGGELLGQLEIDPKDRVGRTIQEIHSPDLLAEIEPYYEAAIEGETNTFEIEFGGRHLYAHTLPVRDRNDEIFGGMIVVQDVTERREYERKLEESNERLEQFAYAASHDLQEPLRMVSSYLQLLEERHGDALNDDGREFLEFAVDGADRMRDMIEGLLQYSRVETQGDPFEPVELGVVLEDVLQDLQMKIEKSNAEITAEDLPQVYGDNGQLTQVFQNLLSNAIEYSGDESPRVHISAERDDDEWVVSVSDEGIGIDPDDQERVFDVFQRLHTHDEHEGTGIGLALCKRIVERHGGEIWIESDPGSGSTFSFTLPVVDGPANGD